MMQSRRVSNSAVTAIHWGSWSPTLAPVPTPADKDPSPGTPVRRKDGARKVCGSWRRTTAKATADPSASLQDDKSNVKRFVVSQVPKCEGPKTPATTRGLWLGQRQ